MFSWEVQQNQGVYMSVGRKRNLESFLNIRNTIELPSNLLTLKKDLARRAEPMGHRLVSHQARLPKAPEAPAYIEEKAGIPEKSVLYKRLSNIRGDNRELNGLSFSKMLSRMVVMDDDEDETPAQTSFDHRMRHTSYVRPISQKLYNLKCDSTTGRLTKSIDIDADKRPSRKLFKKYYMPSSEAAQTLFLQSDNHDKYIYREGKRVECKRIHNFYTSHMFRQGYDKLREEGCFRKSSESFHGR